MGRGLIMSLGALIAVALGSVAFLAIVPTPSHKTPVAAFKKMVPPPSPQPQLPVTFYRWTAPDGVVQLSSTPPPKGTPFETVRVDGSAINTVPSVSASTEMHQAASVNPEVPAQLPSLNPYSPEGIKGIIDQAKQASEAMKAQQAAQQQLLGQ